MIIQANRLEVIDHTSTMKEFARQFVKWEDLPFKISIETQDGGNTVKIFLEDIEKAKHKKIHGTNLLRPNLRPKLIPTL